MEGGGCGLEGFSPQQFQCKLQWNKHITPHYRLKSMKSESTPPSPFPLFSYFSFLIFSFIIFPFVSDLFSIPHSFIPFIFPPLFSISLLSRRNHFSPSLSSSLLLLASEHKEGSADNASGSGCVCSHQQDGRLCVPGCTGGCC